MNAIMSRSQKLTTQIIDLKKILTDYSKLLEKCKKLSQELQKSFANKKDFEELQREINLKIKIVDSVGIGRLRAKLIPKYHQLIDYEHDLQIQHERNNIKRQVETGSKVMKRNMAQQRRNQNGMPNIVEENIKKNKKPDTQLPFYLVKNDSTENKLDSISKFVASLKRSMKILSEGNQHTKLKQFLQNQKQYQQIIQQIQQYKMLQEQLALHFNKKVKQEVARRIQQQHQVVSETKNYKLIKIIKQPTETLNSKDQHPIQLSSDNFDSINLNEDKSDEQGLYSPGKKQSKAIQEDILISQIKKRVEQDFEQMKLALNIQTDKYEEILEKYNQDFGENEASLKNIKSKRKKNFISDDIWNEVADI